jgi:hypothetical protein
MGSLWSLVWDPHGVRAEVPVPGLTLEAGGSENDSVPEALGRGGVDTTPVSPSAQVLQVRSAPSCFRPCHVAVCELLSVLAHPSRGHLDIITSRRSRLESWLFVCFSGNTGD